MANFYKRVCSTLLVLSLLVGVLPTQRVQAAPGTATASGAEESLQADKIAVALTVAAMPEKLYYTEYTEDLDVTGGQIKIYWNDGTSEVMDMTREMVTGFDNTRAGTQEITVTYQNKTASFAVTVNVGKTSLFLSGQGTKENPYVIQTKEHLNNVRLYPDSYFQMIEDIVFSEADFQEGGAFYNNGQGWQPIGDKSTPFSGSFDGSGHTITGLKMNLEVSDTVYAGLFGYIKNGTVTNLGMVDSQIQGKSTAQYNCYAGGIVGYISDGTVSDCWNTGMVTAFTNGNTSCAGGITGYVSDGTVNACRNTGVVTASSVQFSSYAGGIVGTVNRGTISNCYNAGVVSDSDAANSSEYAGGIVASAAGISTIVSCNNTGAVTALDYAGGVGGHLNGGSIIDKSYNTGTITSHDMAGGIAAIVTSKGTISCCYNIGTVTALYDAGGIAGLLSKSTIDNSYNTGEIVSNLDVGGIASGVFANSRIDSCYNVGVVTAPNASNIGSIVDLISDSIINNCYYLDTAEKGIGYGDGDTTVCTWEKMTRQETFGGFDFASVWTMAGSPKYAYPELIGLTIVSPCEGVDHTTILVGDTVPTCTDPGYTGDVYCTRCGLRIEQGQEIEATGHSYGEPVFNWSSDGKSCTVVFTCENDESHVESLEAEITHKVTTPATCENKGVTTYTATVTFQDEVYTATKEVTDAEATGHSYGEPVFNWSSDGKSCTVVFTCENDESHVERLEAEITHQVTTPATCESKGVTTYTATVTFQDEVYTATKEVTDVEATGHSYGEPVFNWSEDGKSCTVVFTCENDESHVESLEAEITHEVTTPATCESKGVTTYTAKVTFQGEDYTATKEVTDVDALGHSYGKPVFNWSEDGKSCTVVFTCENDESHVENLEAKITHEVTTPATCESKGVTTYTATVTFHCEDYTATKEVTDVEATGHSYGEPVFNWASNGKSCTVVFTCENDESHVESLTADITAEITTPATCGVAGETTYTASVTLENRKYSDTLTLADIPALAHDPRLENVREATDTQDGYTGDLVCSHCGEVLKKGQTYELIFRVYHQASGKHHYTADAVERDALVAGGWIYEGIAWNAPKEGKPIYRVYHPATGNHLYTMDASERDFLAANGWNYEGILCYSADSDGVPLYRVCNPYTDRNPHHYTDSLEECDFLESNGWRIEGISWYGLSK